MDDNELPPTTSELKDERDEGGRRRDGREERRTKEGQRRTRARGDLERGRVESWRSGVD